MSSTILPFAALTLSLATLTLAACVGSDGDSAAPQSPPSGVVSSGQLPPPPRIPTEPTPNAITPQSAVDLRRQRWTLAEPVPGTTEVLVHGTLVGGPPCAVLGRVDLRETDDSVTISLWVGRERDAACDGPQPDVGYPFLTRVKLKAPAGTRQIVDGAA